VIYSKTTYFVYQHQIESSSTKKNKRRLEGNCEMHTLLKQQVVLTKTKTKQKPPAM
jgi:hypothetical protein